MSRTHSHWSSLYRHLEVCFPYCSKLKKAVLLYLLSNWVVKSCKTANFFLQEAPYFGSSISYFVTLAITGFQTNFCIECGLWRTCWNLQQSQALQQHYSSFSFLHWLLIKLCRKCDIVLIPEKCCSVAD